MSARPRMHADQIVVGEDLVRRLLDEQFPRYAHLPLREVDSWGTVNAVFRLGGDMTVRVPITPGGGGGNERECDWLGFLAPHLPVAVPTVIGRGRPGAYLPASWSILSWIDGETPVSATDGRTDVLAEELAEVLLALRGVDPAGAPPAGRGPVHSVDDDVRAAIGRLDDGTAAIDAAAITAAWDSTLQAARWSRPPVWVHSDVLPGNVLVTDGRLVGIIDFGGTGVGDPACDLMIVWHLLSSAGRAAFRRRYDVDEDTWIRGRGWALAQGVIALPYYADTNPGMASSARHVIAEVVGDRP